MLELYLCAACTTGEGTRVQSVDLKALKCLNNALWNKIERQGTFVDQGGLDALVSVLKVIQAS